MRTRWLSFRWSPERQEISCDGERFAHPIETNTTPSHDIAHLLAAAAGLAWRPSGTRDEICFSELNAVLIEHVANGVLGGHESASRAVEHARWFVETHYTPFPVTFDVALERFRVVDVEAASRLSPILFRARSFELAHRDFRARTLAAAFSSCFLPDPGRFSAARSDFAFQLGRV